MPGLILHVIQHCGFVDRVNVLDWPADLSPIEDLTSSFAHIIIR